MESLFPISLTLLGSQVCAISSLPASLQPCPVHRNRDIRIYARHRDPWGLRSHVSSFVTLQSEIKRWDRTGSRGVHLLFLSPTSTPLLTEMTKNSVWSFSIAYHQVPGNYMAFHPSPASLNSWGGKGLAWAPASSSRSLQGLWGEALVLSLRS